MLVISKSAICFDVGHRAAPALKVSVSEPYIFVYIFKVRDNCSKGNKSFIFTRKTSIGSYVILACSLLGKRSPGQHSQKVMLRNMS